MLSGKEFNDLWNYLMSNPWDFIDKEKLPATKDLYFHNLKDFDYNQIWKTFDHFIHKKEQRKLPLIQSVISHIEDANSFKNYKSAKPFQSKDRRLHRIYKRMVRQARHIIKERGNNRQMLANCGIKYENLKRKIHKMSRINEVYYHGKTYKLKDSDSRLGFE